MRAFHIPFLSFLAFWFTATAVCLASNRQNMSNSTVEPLSASQQAAFYIDVVSQPLVMILCVALVIIVATFQCLKKQPIWHKNFLYVIIVARFLSCIFQLFPSLPSMANTRCYVFSFFVVPVNFTGIFIYALVAFQVVIQRLAQTVKQNFAERNLDKETQEKIPLALRIGKVLLSKWIAFILYMLFISLIIGVHLFLYFVPAKQNCTDFGSMVRISVIVIYISLSMVIVALLVFDVISQRCHPLACCITIFKNDPLAYSLEVLVAVIALLSVMALTFIMSQVKSVPDIISTSVLKLLADIITLSVVPGISIAATIRYECLLVRHKSKQSRSPKLQVFNPSEETIRLIMADSQVASMFKEFAKRELSLENVLFFVRCNTCAYNFQGTPAPIQSQTHQTVRCQNVWHVFGKQFCV